MFLDFDDLFKGHTCFLEQGLELPLCGGLPAADSDAFFPVHERSLKSHVASTGSGDDVPSGLLELILGHFWHGDEELHDSSPFVKCVCETLPGPPRPRLKRHFQIHRVWPQAN